MCLSQIYKALLHLLQNELNKAPLEKKNSELRSDYSVEEDLPNHESLSELKKRSGSVEDIFGSQPYKDKLPSNVKRSFSDELENSEISSHPHDERSPSHEDEVPDNNLSLDLGSVSDNSSTSTFDSETLAATLER